MLHFRTVFAATVCFFFIFAVSLYSADIAKIGVVDFQKILETSSAGKLAQAEINKQGKRMEDDLKKKGAEIEALKKRLERESMVMKKEMREEKEREFRIKLNDLKTLKNRYQLEARDIQERFITRIQKEVLDFVEKVGKEEGYLIIIEKRQGGVLYCPNKIDLTDKLVKDYNSWFAKNKDKKR